MDKELWATQRPTKQQVASVKLLPIQCLPLPYKFKYNCLTSGSCPSAKPLKLTTSFSAGLGWSSLPKGCWGQPKQGQAGARGRGVNAHMCWCQSGLTVLPEVTPHPHASAFNPACQQSNIKEKAKGQSLCTLPHKTCHLWFVNAARSTISV